MVTSSPEVCMTWRQPAIPNGVISLYRVYAEPLNTSRDIHVSIDLPVTTVVKVQTVTTIQRAIRSMYIIVTVTNSKTYVNQYISFSIHDLV